MKTTKIWMWAAGVAAVLGLAAAGLSWNRGAAAREWVRLVEALEDAGEFSRLSGTGAAATFHFASHDPAGGNDDYNRFAGPGSEPGWVVLADVEGPGVLDRFWMTGVDEGYQMKIYVDDETEPKASGAVEELLGGGRGAWGWPLSECLNLCWWSYVPVPFAKRLRIEGEAPPVHRFWGPRRLYVQGGGRRMAAKTVPAGAWGELGAAVRKRAEASLGASMDTGPVGWDEEPWLEVPPGESAVVWSAAGSGALDRWALALEPADASAGAMARQAMLQDTVLEVRYGGAPDGASISVPVGDFFCNAWRKRNFSCLAMRSADDGWECRLPLAWGNGVEVRLANRGTAAVRARFRGTGRRERRADEGYLHAAWNKSGAEERGRPHSVVSARGPGKYVGCYIAETSLDGSWWLLEGDETMVVDGVRRAGSGMEDYFNGGWYYRGCSFTPWSGILDRCPFRAGQYRFHAQDAVPFRERFDMEVERGDRNVSRGIVRSVAFFYAESPLAVPGAAARGDRAAEANPQEDESLMVQLFELERAGDWRACETQLDEWLETHPDADPEVRGVLRLRRAEYGWLTGSWQDGGYDGFLSGAAGEAARVQAGDLAWMHEAPGRYLVGCANHARARVAVDGRMVETRAHPLRLFVQRLELPDGPHRLEVTAVPAPGEPSPWVQTGLRGREGVVAATGPGLPVARADGSTELVSPRDVCSGAPNPTPTCSCSRRSAVSAPPTGTPSWTAPCSRWTSPRPAPASPPTAAP